MLNFSEEFESNIASSEKANGYVKSKDGTRIYYEIRGKGPAIIISNNFFMTASQWESLLPNLSNFFTVVNYDLRHQGQSDRVSGQINIQDHVDDMHAVFEFLGIEKAAILGTCISTLIARDFAIKFPTAVSAAIFVGPIFSAFGNLYRKFLHKSLLNTLKQSGPSGLFDHYYPLLYTARGIEANRIPGYLALKTTFVQNNPMEQLEKHLQSTLNVDDSLEVLQQVIAPSLILCGEDDFLTSISSLEVLIKVLPNARYELIPMAGHNPYIEAASQFEESVKSFLIKTLRETLETT